MITLHRALSLAFAIIVLPPAAVAAPPRQPPRAAPPRPVPIWERQFLSAPPAEIIRSAAAIATPANSDVHVLFQETSLRYGANGSLERRHHYVALVASAAGVRESSEFEARWLPWRQERPTFRARVITSDGLEHRLDPGTVEESGVGAGGDMYGDTRRLRAPLPAVAVGAVIEQEIILRDPAPAFPDGDLERQYLGGTWPIWHARLVLDAPASLPLRYVVKNAALTPERRVAADRVTVTFDNGPSAAIPVPPDGAPSETPWPHVLLTTSRSWNDGAAEYARIVAAQLAKTNRAQLAAIAREALGPSPPPKETIRIADLLLAYVHKQVRYTGVEFGAASIVPRTPAETLERRYGDCKDQALLMVALLDAAGVSARVALLRATTGDDIDETLPGLSRFNHAIVYVPGKAPLWIDPTSQFARSGELPAWDRNRRALVADGATRGLERTPEARPDANRVTETRQFFLAERGAARIVEVTDATGTFERALRSQWDTADPVKANDAIANYARTEYAAKGTTKLDHSEARALDKPFQLRIEISGAKRGSSDEQGAAVAIRPAALLQHLPHAFTEEDDDKRARTVDYVIAEPFVYEWVYRIVPPPGFAAKPLPPSDTRALGPCRFVSTYAVEKSGDVVARLRLEALKKRLTPAEVEAVHAAYVELKAAPWVTVEFVQLGRDHLDNGRVRQSLEQFRALAALHPTEAIHHEEIARALLVAGFADAARDEAQRAISLEPNRARSHWARGWILEHDSLGRRFGDGWDPKGAEAAFRRAIQLDPKDALPRADLAILLEHDADGARYGARARLADAATEYRAMAKETGNDRMHENVLFVLLYQRKWQELETTARALPSSMARNQLLVAAVAARQGAAAGSHEATRVAADNRAQLLQGAGEQLFRTRMYPEAAALIEEAARANDTLSAARVQLTMLHRLKRHEAVVIDAGDPTSVVRNMLLAMIGSHSRQFADFRPFFSRDLAGDLGEADNAVLAMLRNASDRMARRFNIPNEVLLDLVSSMVELKKEGDDQLGYRVHVSAAAGVDFTAQDWYVVKESGQYRVAAGAGAVSSIARRALRLLDGGDLAGAHRWLSWIGPSAAPPASDPMAVAVGQAMNAGATGTAEEARLAAACIIGFGGNPADLKVALPLLQSARTGKNSDLADGLAMIMAIAYGRMKQPANLLPIAEALALRHPEASLFGEMRLDTLGQLGRWEALKRLADERLRDGDDDPLRLRALAYVAEAQSSWEEVERLLRRAVSRDPSTPNDSNRLAWAALFRKPVPPAAALDDAKRAVEQTSRQRPHVLHTLASVYAELDRPAEARDALLELIELQGGALQSSNHYVLGRIAQSYGLADIAAMHYRTVVRPTAELPSLSAWALAQRNLAALTAATSTSAAKKN